MDVASPEPRSVCIFHIL